MWHCKRRFSSHNSDALTCISYLIGTQKRRYLCGISSIPIFEQDRLSQKYNNMTARYAICQQSPSNPVAKNMDVPADILCDDRKPPAVVERVSPETQTNNVAKSPLHPKSDPLSKFLGNLFHVGDLTFVQDNAKTHHRRYGKKAETTTTSKADARWQSESNLAPSSISKKSVETLESTRWLTSLPKVPSLLIPDPAPSSSHHRHRNSHSMTNFPTSSLSWPEKRASRRRMIRSLSPPNSEDEIISSPLTSPTSTMARLNDSTPARPQRTKSREKIL